MILHVGSYGEAIHVLRMDPASGALAVVQAVDCVRNGSFLAYGPGGRVLYAVNEGKAGEASAFAVEPGSGRLSLLNRVATRGADPCHLCLAGEGGVLLVANYSSGQVTVLPILRDGRLGEAADVVTHAGRSVHPQRQSAPHPHHVAVVGAEVLVTDLGLDQVLRYRLDGARLVGAGVALDCAPGAGPRQTVWDGDAAFVINELGASVTKCRWAEGGLTPERTASTLPDGFTAANLCAQLEVRGGFVYASNRGHDSIAVMRREDLTMLGWVASGGRMPRHFAIDPSGRFMVVANQEGSLRVFRIDEASGMPVATGQGLALPAPVCVVFA